MKFPTYEEMGKKIAEEALDGYIYKGKTIREWIDILAQAQWIPVSERLPELKQRILVSYETMDDGKKVDITTYDKYGFLIGKAHAWMPLPEPYKGE